MRLARRERYLLVVFGALALWRVVQRRTVLPIDDEATEET